VFKNINYAFSVQQSLLDLSQQIMSIDLSQKIGGLFDSLGRQDTQIQRLDVRLLAGFILFVKLMEFIEPIVAH
jgi:hypothetical protein